MLIYSFTLFINLFKDRSLFIGGSCRIRSPIDYPSAAGVAGTASHQYPLRNWENPPDFRPNIYVYICICICICVCKCICMCTVYV